jgi:methylenetetrahydrofolate--tRNA-(uracil-5-)-methyltransferase
MRPDTAAPKPQGVTVSQEQQTPRAGVVGGGLAGCECALALARAGVPVVLWEMRPGRTTPAHQSDRLAELVCSNSLRSDEPEAAVGVLKDEMRALGSAVMLAAQETRLPAGKALAVDRERFAARMTELVAAEPLVEVRREEVASLDAPGLQGLDAVVVAAGPLASEALSASLAAAVGGDHLYFYDAIAPIVAAESVDQEVCFWASRYGTGESEEGDYLNCPMDEAQYLAFRQALLDADKVAAREFEQERHFEACLPIETLAERGELSLAYGPFKPVGLEDPRTGERPCAVVQLRAENREKTALNLVGCQTKLKYGEQDRVFRLIPGLENAEFLRYGSMHRNTFVDAPRVLGPDLSLRTRPGVHLAGQITGVEGYVESAACGLWLGLLLGARLTGKELPDLPLESGLGALLRHLRTPAKRFQPSNVNYGLTPALQVRARKRERKALYAQRARDAFGDWLRQNREALPPAG